MRIKGDRSGAPATKTTQTQKKSRPLEDMRAKTADFILKKGSKLFGAGNLPNISDRAPRSSKKVNQAVGTVLHQKVTSRKK